MQHLRKREDGKKQADQMPAVGTRRSTRVFVPKSASKVAAVEVGDTDGASVAATVVLRSGKRLLVSKPAGKKVETDECKGGWMRLFGWKGEEVKCGGDMSEKGDGLDREGGGKCREDETLMSVVETDEGGNVASGKKFGIVYSRKRRTLASDDVHEKHNVKDRRFGLSFTRRKQHKTKEIDTAMPKVPSLAEKIIWKTTKSIGGYQIPFSTRSFAVNVGVCYGDLWNGDGEPGVLLVLVDISDHRNLSYFESFLLSTLSGMRKTTVNLLNFSSFLLSNSIANVFSNHGVHFLPLKWDRYISCRNATSGAGICGIVGTQMLVPFLSVGFSALPFYFKTLHLSMLLSLRCHALNRYSPFRGRPVDFSGVVAVPEPPSTTNLTSESRDTDIENGMPDKMICDEINANPVIHQLSRLEDTHILHDPKLVVENGAAHWMKVRRHQKKRTSLRSARAWNSLQNSKRSGVSSIHKRILKVNSAAKTNSRRRSAVVPTFADVIDSCADDLSGSMKNHVDTSPMSPYQDQNISAQKSYAETPKELKSTLSMLKQNIDSIRAKANILYIETDRCWREEGAEVMLEASDSNEWFLAVKVNGSIRYLHKPQEMKLCTTNRFTHGIIWTSESSWKLEFSNRMDWFMFKELHQECYGRNSHFQDVNVNTNSKKMIPVPVVRIVPGYEDAPGTFVRPDFYIKTKHDELERALVSTTSYYDMDSEDETWLERLNCNLPIGGSGVPAHVSNDDFEKVIFALEKVAYNNPDEASDPGKAISYCSEFGSKDVLAAIFEYYCSKKEKHKRTALIRVFKELSRKMVATQKPFLRKKRSLKRQGTHSGRGKPEIYLQVGALKEELRRVEETKRAAIAAMEVARRSRCRAQILMANADLATYKAALTLRLAEAIQDAALPDVSSILD